MFNILIETTERRYRQKEYILLEALRGDFQCEEQNSGSSAQHLNSEFRKECKRRNKGENVRRAKASLFKGSNFLHECRPRKGRYSLNCAVMRRCADKEPHDNKLETPFLTMAERVKAKAVYHEWQTDALATAATNRQIEGDDASGGTATPTVRLGNYCQTSSKYAVVTDVQQAVDHAGRGSEMSYQIAKRLGELKRDMEYALTQTQGATAGAAAGARSSAGIESWLTNPSGTANNVGNSTSLGTGGNYTTPGFTTGGFNGPTDASLPGTFVVSALKAVIAACWTAGGNPGIIMVGAAQKQVVSGFSGIATLYREAGNTSKGTAIVGAADLYISDFGEHRIVPNRFQRNKTCLILDMDYWAVAYLEKVSQKPIARTGSAEKRLIDTTFTLVAKNPNSSGKVADLV